MKKFFSFAVTAMAILGLGSLTSCHDEDFDVSTAVLQERAFEQGFIKEFGQPSADQGWDFYAQKMQSLREKGAATRAASPDQVVITPAAANQYLDQPAYAAAIVSDIVGVKEGNEWTKYGILQDELDNSHVGQNHYSLTSTGQFNIYPIVYGGDYQKKQQYGFVFGLAYIDGSNKEQKVPLFRYKTSTSSDPINPGWGKHVDFPVGETFYFYMSINIGWYNYNDRIPYTYTFRSNSSTFTRTYTTTNYYGQTTEHAAGTYNYVDEVIKDENHQVIAGEGPRTYDGPSTLVATKEVKGDDGKDKQIMIIGFEDGWQGDPDDDFNDVVLIIEGDLPEPTSKRFFAEDKNSFDWDYNDVVFDVMNTGIVLRAVGGTLPVWLRVTDKNDRTTTTEELHTLMRSIQPQVGHREKQLWYERDVIVNGQKEKKKFYKPIDVAANPGIWFDAVQIIRWKIDDNTRLTDEQLERFANPSASNPLGKIELIVGTEFEQSLDEVLAHVDDEDEATKIEQPKNGYWENAEEKSGLPTIVKVGETGKIPAIWTGPVSIMWMKELQKITRAYPGFYGGGTTPEGSTLSEWWSVETVNKSFCYDYTGDPD